MKYPITVRNSNCFTNAFFFPQFVWLGIQVRFTHCDWLMYLIVSFNLYGPTFPTLLSVIEFVEESRLFVL